MMHHPNMHHQAMSGHPPQHMPGHRAISAHHTLPPPLHGENRHVTLTRVPLGPGGGSLGAHGHALGALGVPVPRPPHAIRAMHHPQQQHHVPPQMKPMRRGYVGGGYGAGGAVLHTYAPATPHHVTHTHTVPPTAPAAGGPGVEAAPAAEPVAEALPEEPPRPPASITPANSKEKTPMCLVNELARYNKIKHQYRLTSETGPAHKKVFTVTLRLGDTEEYTAEGSSIKRAQHAAASAALSATSFTAPPPRAAAAHSPPHAHHRHSVMPTVELNALAMKLCQPAVYSTMPGVPLGARPLRARWPPFPGPGAVVYRVRVAVGGRAWLGEGATPQAARHDAAARALRDLRHDQRAPACEPPPAQDAEENGDPLTSDVKSPVSLVHELALKRNLTVQFTVKSERGPPHMRVFVTACIVGDMETEGEGNGKKVSKRRAAEKMLEEMRRRWPPALLRPRLQHDKRRHQPAKKKPRNLIKVHEESQEPPAEGASTTGAPSEAGGACGGDNPISRLAVARHAARARSPQYRVLEERGAARRREFLVQCLAPPHAATGLGPNKKTAKRRAAHNVLLAMELLTGSAEPGATDGDTDGSSNTADTKTNNNDAKRKDSETQNSSGGNSEVRQPVPGVLLMDYHQRSGQPHQPNGVSETSATGGSGGNTPGAKDQLMYLSQLLGFTVQFSDFPKRNHGEYLSLVSLSTEPPVMCHGGGPSTAHSHEQCSRAALRALALMGLDTMQGSGGKPAVVTNGVAE